MSRHHPSPAVQFTHALVRCQVLLQHVERMHKRGAALHVGIQPMREVMNTLEKWIGDIETGRVGR